MLRFNPPGENGPLQQMNGFSLRKGTVNLASKIRLDEIVEQEQASENFTEQRSSFVYCCPLGSAPVPINDRFRPSFLDSWLPWLNDRWDGGTRNALALWREMRAEGFVGQSGVVSQWAQRRRLA